MGENNDVFDQSLGSEKSDSGSHDPGVHGSFAAVFDSRLVAARDGSLSALGSVFEECRNYLLLVANRELGHSIRAKFGASDLVQETFLQGQEVFERFKGTSRQELAAWLTQILKFKLAQAQRRFVDTQKRDVSREQPVQFTAEDELRDLRLPRRPLPDQAVEHVEELETLNRAMLRLRKEMRTKKSYSQGSQPPLHSSGERAGEESQPNSKSEAEIRISKQ
jgi:DNA-directed RNA polymerase specialized sigma24 family protein